MSTPLFGVIVVSYLVKNFISSHSRVAGALFGFLITTGILLLGLLLYSGGGAMMIGVIELSQPVFLGVCVIWYLMDLAELVNAVNLALHRTAPIEGQGGMHA